MQIDWVIVGAQIINFLVLVYLLKRFLYTPIIAAMDRRQQNIAASLEDAQHKAEAAEQQGEHYRQLMRDLETEKAELLNEALQQVVAERQQQLEELRSEIEGVRGQWLNELQRDQDSFNKSLRQAIGEQACSISRQVLAGLAGAQLEQQITQAFVQQLQNLSPAETQQLRDASQQGKLQLHSSQPLSQAEQSQLQDSLKQLLGADTPLHFQLSPELLSGLSLRGSGYKIDWNIDSYLGNIEDTLRHRLLAGLEK